MTPFPRDRVLLPRASTPSTPLQCSLHHLASPPSFILPWPDQRHGRVHHHHQQGPLRSTSQTVSLSPHWEKYTVQHLLPSPLCHRLVTLHLERAQFPTTSTHSVPRQIAQFTYKKGQSTSK